MSQKSKSWLQIINSLMIVIRSREDLFLKLISFINKNIESSSDQMGQISLLNKFLLLQHKQHQQITYREEETLHKFTEMVIDQSSNQHSTSIEVMRLSARIDQILEISMNRTRNTIFDQNGRIISEFTRFRNVMNSIIKSENIQMRNLASHVMNYSRNKYIFQLKKLEKYLKKLEKGDNIALREIYGYHSDLSGSPEHSTAEDKFCVELKKIYIKKKNEYDQPELGTTNHRVLRKNLKNNFSRNKKTINLKNMVLSNRQEQNSTNHKSTNKQTTANKLLKFYSLLQLNRKQFLQDYIYENQKRQSQQARLMQNLIQKNRTIKTQINGFMKKSTSYCRQNIDVLNNNNSIKNSSDENQLFRIDSSLSHTTNNNSKFNNTNLNLRNNFIISKRKASFNFQASIQRNINNDLQSIKPFTNTIKNIKTKSNLTTTKNRNKSKKIFIVKPPINFEDEIIPSFNVPKQQYLIKPPLTNRKQRRNQNLRLRKKNNPIPMETTFYPQPFKYSDVF